MRLAGACGKLEEDQIILQRRESMLENKNMTSKNEWLS
jgi:hypothetical protein